MAAIPTVEVVGDAGRIKINASDLAQYERDGYKLVGEEPVPQQPAEPVEEVEGE